MTITHKDTNSPYQLTFPDQRDHDGIFTLAGNYIAYEQTRPPDQQTFYTADITGWYEELVIAKQEKIAAQSRRAIASQKIKQSDAEATELVRHMWKTVTHHCHDMLSEVTQWGFKMKQTTGNALMPRNRDDRLATMTAYIIKEQSRPEEERFPKPDLAAIIVVRDELKASLVAYQTADTQRRNCDERSGELLYNLSEFLQAGGVEILGRLFRMKVSTQMRNWGFDVTLKRRKPTKTEETTSTNGAAADSSTNGSTTLDATVNGQGSVEVDGGTLSFTD